MAWGLRESHSDLDIVAEKLDGKSVYELLGGRETLEKVHKTFYDKLYEDPWMKQFFSEIDQTHIENQQTDFMSMALGGPKVYMGALPIAAHKRIFIPEELFELRHNYLKESLKENHVPDHLAEKWLGIDRAFKKALVKSSVSECEKRFFTDEIVIHQNPANKFTG